MSKLGGSSKLDQQKFGIEQTQGLKCDSCGKQVFSQGMVLRKVPSIVTGTGQPGIVPIPVFYCVNCGHVNDEFLPEELKGEVNTKELAI